MERKIFLGVVVFVFVLGSVDFFVGVRLVCFLGCVLISFMFVLEVIFSVLRNYLIYCEIRWKKRKLVI